MTRTVSRFSCPFDIVVVHLVACRIHINIYIYLHRWCVPGGGVLCTGWPGDASHMFRINGGYVYGWCARKFGFVCEKQKKKVPRKVRINNIHYTGWLLFHWCNSRLSDISKSAVTLLDNNRLSFCAFARLLLSNHLIFEHDVTVTCIGSSLQGWI